MSRRCLSLLVLSALFVLALPARAAEPTTYAWVEAEDYESTNVPEDELWTGSDRAHLLSKDEWLAAHPNKKTIDQTMPEGGYRFTWKLDVPETGEYEAWARVGMEWVRNPFEWRVGDGEWHPASDEAQTTNVMLLKAWNEIAWLKLGTVRLERGATELTVRYSGPKEGSADMWMVLDCFAFTRGQWVPEGDLKPGQKYDSEIDRKAAEQVFRLPEPADDAARSELELTGAWQVARYDDPDMDLGRFDPVRELPDADEYPLRWRGIDVPATQWSVDGLNLAHRTIYRTKVDVPAGHRGRGFKLHFSGTNWIVGVFVNGRFAGSHRGVWIPWDLDITEHVKPGRTNEIAVAVKSSYYAIDHAHYRPGTDLDHHRNRAYDRLSGVTYVAPVYPSSKGDGDGRDYGIVNPVTLVAVGDAYTEDVFIKPSVEKKRLDVDVTVRNTDDRARTFRVRCAAVHDGTGRVEKEFGPVEVRVPAQGTATAAVSGPWQDPKLWWPLPDPDLYRLRTTVMEGGRAVDVQEELFGFREVTIEDTGIYINGVRRNLWCWVSVAGRPWDGPSWLERFRGENNRFTRFSKNRKPSFFLPSREERLEFYDRNGIPGRLCSMIDGMYISFNLGNRRELDSGERVFEPNELLWGNFRRHIAQLTRAYRNHPSVIFYQVENELVYINGMNRHSGEELAQIEDWMAEVVDAGRKNDPTRPYTVGGGGDLGGPCEINGPHYPVTDDDYYPENAYTLERYSNKISRYPWDRKKPWLSGESAAGQALRYAPWMIGDEGFRSAEHADRGKARYLRMLYGGYRWQGVAGFFPWDNLSHCEDARKIFSDLCVIPRRQTRRLHAGRRNELRFKVMNDTFSDEPVTFEWTYRIGDRKVAGETVKLSIEPGFGREQTLVINAPQAAERLDGVLTLKVTQPGAPDYVDARGVPVLPVVERIRLDVPVTVLDPAGETAEFLSDAGVEFKRIEKLAEAKGGEGLLLIGPDALAAREALGRDILAYAAAGNGVIVLEQKHPVAGGNLPAPVQTTTHFGGYAHPAALGTSVFRDLGKDDLTDWLGGHPTYKNVYRKPSQGGRSLAGAFGWADGAIEYSPLLEVPCGRGVVLLCQLRVGEKLGVEPAADVLLRNLIDTYAGYRPPAGVAGVYAPGNRPLLDNVRATGRFAEPVDDLASALDPEEYTALVVDATEENLRALNRLSAKAAAYQETGGWIMLNGVSPESIEEFNSLMDTDHIIRNFRIERVTMERSDYPLAATLGCQDVAMFSTRKMIHNRRWVGGDTYSYVVDGRDFAPFCLMPDGPDDPFVYEPTYNDRDPYNLVNGMFVSDDWRYYYSVWVDEGADHRELTFRLRQPEMLDQINLWTNNVYWAIKDMDVILDGDRENKVSVTLPVSSKVNQIKLPEPRRVGRTITFDVKSWRKTNRARPDVRLLGIDYVQFLRPEPPQKATFIDNVGGLVAYPRGEGGVFLNQIKFMEDEPYKENVGKKRNLTGVILRNMGVGSETKVVPVPGVNIRYRTLDITDYCNRHVKPERGQQAWFGGEGMDLRNLPMGEHEMGDVLFHTVDYATAPVPDCIMLSADEDLPGLPKKVEGIQVGQKSDFVFFLQAARVRRGISSRAREHIGSSKRPYFHPTITRYVVHYADGETATAPMILEKNVQHWLQEDPTPLPGAPVAAAVPLPGGPDVKGVLYAMQWKNLRPDVEIASIDMELLEYMGDIYGYPSYGSDTVLLAITLGDVVE